MLQHSQLFQDWYTACGGRFLGLALEVATSVFAGALMYGRDKPSWTKQRAPWLCELAEIPDPNETEWSEEE